MKLKCPKDHEHNTFEVDVQETARYVVDELANTINDKDVQVTDRELITVDHEFYCALCGTQAEVTDA